MRRATLGLMFGTLLLTTTAGARQASQSPTPAPPPAVKVGQPAPDFTLPYLSAGADGKVQQKSASLSSYRGHTIILAFFPAAFSPG